VASNQISGQTLHSLLRLPVDGPYQPLSETPTVLSTLQRQFEGVEYLVIDEKSMLGLKILGWIDRRLREIFPGNRDEFFGGLTVLLIGDSFQLPPVLNKSLYTTDVSAGSARLYIVHAVGRGKNRRKWSFSLPNTNIKNRVTIRSAYSFSELIDTKFMY